MIPVSDDPESNAEVDDIWTISNVLYFDVAQRVFKRADVEICGKRIVGIASPDASSSCTGIEGDELICMPGLVNACLPTDDDPVVDEHQCAAQAADAERAGRLGAILSNAVAHGVTTVGLFSRRGEDDISVLAKAGLRTSLYLEYMDVWLGPEARTSGPRGLAECLHDYERMTERFNSEVLAIQPAVGSQLAASTHLLTALHDLAKSQGRRFVIRVDGGSPWIESFRDAYWCSGMALLRNLDLIDEHTLIMVAMPLTSLEWKHLRKCETNLIHEAHELGAATGRHGTRARIDITNRLRAALRWRPDELPCPNDIEEGTGDELAGDILDLLTWKGAKAMGFPETGCISVGKRADLLLYDRGVLRGGAGGSTDCVAVLKMLSRHQPQGVLIDGRWVVRGSAVRDKAVAHRHATLPGFRQAGLVQARDVDKVFHSDGEANSGTFLSSENEKIRRDIAV